MLIGTNFKKWKENIMIVLSFMDFKVVIQADCLASLTATSTIE